jgi:hypothetical protein
LKSPWKKVVKRLERKQLPNTCISIVSNGHPFLLPRKKRPVDTELLGVALLSDESYVDILGYVARSAGGRCTMTDLKTQFAGDTRGSMLYYKASRLEKAKLLKIRSDGMQNFLELTPKAQEEIRHL